MLYADNAATTQLSDNALFQMLPYLQEWYGNPSSTYSFGVKVKRAIEIAREQVASAINAKSDEIVFTSSGSESNSWVISSIKSGHVVTSAIEHQSVLSACRSLEDNGVQVTYVLPDNNGVVEAGSILSAIRSNTKLVSIMLANNEIGTLQPISKIAHVLRKKDILLHTDAVQAVGHIPVDVNQLGVDFLSASAHKFNGAKGTGILYNRKGTKLSSIIFGGEQERALRAGTENVAGIVGMGYAIAESTQDIELNSNKLKILVDKTICGIQNCIPEVIINGGGVERLPGILNLSFGKVSGESIMHLLDLKGICVSTGSACTSGKNEPSHVLNAIGLSYEQALSSIRISYGKYNDISDADVIIRAIWDVYQRLLKQKIK